MRVRPLLGSFLASMLACAMMLSLPGCLQQAKFKAQASSAITSPQASSLEVHSRNGGIVVMLGDGSDITVSAEIRAMTQERADAVTIGSTIGVDGAVMIEPVWPGGGHRSNESCSLSITLPRAMPLTLRTGNGAIEVSGMSGLAVLRTSNGRIEVHGHDGRIEATTSNGAIRLSGISGPVVCDTSNGAVEVELADSNPGPVRIGTSNGGVELAVGAGFAGELSARTSNGSISAAASGARLSASGKNSIRLRFPTAGEPSSIETSNGAVTIRGR